ncbi:MAG TPA: hypothetical protein VMV49_01890 [Candidatus Deferrimicrobium sp.]|nr:hypothetical protein [Candidatus Deferrimicrobium sp.]
MTNEKKPFLWVGSVSQTQKAAYLFLGGLLQFLSYLFLWGIFDSLSYYKEYPPFDLIMGLFCFIVFISFFWFSGGILISLIRGYPKYYLTNDQLVSKVRMPWGALKIKVINLAEIQTIVHLVDESSLNSMHFYAKPVDILLEEVAGMRKPRSLKNQESWTPLGKSNFKFGSVNSPLELIEALESLLPLKPHPSLKYVYQRID